MQSKKTQVLFWPSTRRKMKSELAINNLTRLIDYSFPPQCIFCRLNTLKYGNAKYYNVNINDNNALKNVVTKILIIREFILATLRPSRISCVNLTFNDKLINLPNCEARFPSINN